MQGTEKQVKWAASIKAEKMQVIAPQLAKMDKLLANKPSELAKVAALRAALDSQPASWWIDNRDVFGLDLLKIAGHAVDAAVKSDGGALAVEPSPCADVSPPAKTAVTDAKADVVAGPFALVAGGNATQDYLLDGDDIEERAIAHYDSAYYGCKGGVYRRGIPGFGVQVVGGHIVDIYETREAAECAIARNLALLES